MLARAARYARAGAAGAAPRPAPRPIFNPKAGTSPLRQLLAHRGAPELTALQKLTGAAGVVTAAGVGYVGWERAKVFAFQCLPEVRTWTDKYVRLCLDCHLWETVADMHDSLDAKDFDAMIKHLNSLKENYNEQCRAVGLYPAQFRKAVWLSCHQALSLVADTLIILGVGAAAWWSGHAAALLKGAPGVRLRVLGPVGLAFAAPTVVALTVADVEPIRGAHNSMIERHLQQPLDEGLRACYVLGVAARAPIYEELLFRGVLLTALCPVIGAAPALAVSSVLFVPRGVPNQFSTGRVDGARSLLRRGVPNRINRSSTGRVDGARSAQGAAHGGSLTEGRLPVLETMMGAAWGFSYLLSGTLVVPTALHMLQNSLFVGLLEWARASEKNTPLQVALMQGRKDDVAAMLATPGYPVNAPNAHGDTALMFACALGDVELVEALLAKGADPLARASSGVWEGLDARAVAEQSDQDEIRALLVSP